MNNDGTLIPSRGVTHPAPLAVPLQNGLSQAAEVLIILPFQRVTGRAQTKSKDLPIPARAMQRALNWTLHSYAPDEDRPLFAAPGFLEREAASAVAQPKYR